MSDNFEQPNVVQLPPGVQKTTDKLPANCGWDLDPELIRGRALEEVRVTPENATLFRFSPRPNLDPSRPSEPQLYLGLRPALRVDGDMGIPQMAVYQFPDGVSGEALQQTTLILPCVGAPPDLGEVIGLICTNVYRNNSPDLQLPPRVIGNGFFIEFGEVFLEINTVGLMMHRPKGPRVLM